MSVLSRIRDFVLLRDLPANQPPVEIRSAYGAQPPSWMLNKPVWPKQNVNTYVNEGYAKLALFFRCALAVSNAIATAPLRVYLDAGGGQKVAQDTHAIRRLMAAPNFLMSEAEFWAFVGIALNTVGFCVVEKDRSLSGRVIALWPLRPDWVKEIPREYAPSDWEYRIPGRDPTTILARDVIVTTYAADPLGSTTGIGPAQVLLREVGIANVMTDYIKLFFDQGAMPRYALIPRDKEAQYSQPEVDAVKAAWMQRYGGLLRSVEPAFLDGIEDVKEIGFDINEMAYPDLSKLTEARIATGFGVPPIFVGALVGLENAPWSNIGSARRLFYEDTVTPLWARLDGAFTRGLLRDFEDRPGYELGFDTSDVPALQQDVAPVWTRADAGVRGGWVTVNDARREANLPPVIGGDVFLRSLVTVEQPALTEQKRRSNGHAIDVQVREITPKALGSGALYRLPMERRATIASAAKETIARIGERFAPTLAAFWREQGERVIAEAKRSAVYNWQAPKWNDEIDWATDAVNGFTDSAKRLANITDRFHLGLIEVELTEFSQERLAILRAEWRDIAAINWEQEEEALLGVLQRLHVVAGESAFASVAELTGVTGIAFDIANPFVRDVLRLLAQRIVGINAATRADVQRVVGQALDDGVSLPELGERLKGLFEETYKNRALTVGRTESQAAYNLGSRLGYQQSGVVTHVEMADNAGHGDYDGDGDGWTCAQRDGAIIPVEQIDQHALGTHPNCQLACIPLLSTPLGEE